MKRRKDKVIFSRTFLLSTILQTNTVRQWTAQKEKFPLWYECERESQAGSTGSFALSPVPCQYLADAGHQYLGQTEQADI